MYSGISKNDPVLEMSIAIKEIRLKTSGGSLDGFVRTISVTSISVDKREKLERECQQSGTCMWLKDLSIFTV